MFELVTENRRSGFASLRQGAAASRNDEQVLRRLGSFGRYEQSQGGSEQTVERLRASHLVVGVDASGNHAVEVD
jgi:hypothetical protein